MFIDKKYLLIAIIVISVISCGKDDKVENKRPPESSQNVELSKEQILKEILEQGSKDQSSNKIDTSRLKAQELGLTKKDKGKPFQKPIQSEVPKSSTKDKKVSVSKPAKQNDGLYLIVIILLSIATIISTVIAYYLYKWRIVVREANMQIMVPESFDSKMKKFESGMKKFESGFNKLASHLIQNQSTVNNSVAASSEKMDEMMQAFLSLQQVIDKKDEEIKRLREGYDVTIFKSFLNRFIRVDLAMREQLYDEKNVNIEDLEYIYQILEDAFDECGVTLYIPPFGADIRDLDGISDSRTQIPTEDKEKVYTIARVIEAGYKIDSDGKPEFIRPAKVEVYVPE